MKRILLATVILIGVSQAATAQTSGSNSSNAPSVSSSTAALKKTKGKKAQVGAADTLNNRKMYNWKDGQRATPTGHEATGTNGGYAALGSDSATATRRDSTKQQ